MLCPDKGFALRHIPSGHLRSVLLGDQPYRFFKHRIAQRI